MIEARAVAPQASGEHWDYAEVVSSTSGPTRRQAGRSHRQVSPGSRLGTTWPTDQASPVRMAAASPACWPFSGASAAGTVVHGGGETSR
jgi:hypothetical protein